MWTLSEKGAWVRSREQEKVNARLKANKQEPIDDYMLDLRLLGMIPFAHPLRHEFLLRVWSHQWPTEMVIEVDGEVNYWLIRMAKEFCRQKRLILLGCGSSGKSYGLSGYAYSLWKCSPFATSVYLSTTSAEAGEARAFGTVKDLHNKDRYKFGKLISSLRVITLDEETRNEEGDKERDYRNCVKAVLIKSGAEGKNVVGTICGRKNRVVLWGCDEMPFMDTGILDARVNLFSNDFAQFIGVGNGPEEGDPLYIDGEPFGPEFPDGWRSVNPDIHEGWTTRTGYCLYFNGLKSPNLMIPKGKKPIFPSLMDWNKLEELKKVAGGEDTPIYWRQVIGLAPGVDVPDKIVTYKLLQSNRALEQPVWMDLNWKTVAGLDLGFRDGGDPTTIDFGKVGTEETGRQILAFSGDAMPLLPLQSSKAAFEEQISRQVIKLCRERDCHDLALDVTGDGGILLQHIERVAREEKFKLGIVAVSFSGTADDAIRTPGDVRKPTDIYANKVSQIWAQFRVCVINGVIRGCNAHHQSVKELCGRRFSTDEKKRFLVEKKSDYKKRLRHSPDRGDARCLCAFMAIKVGLSGEMKTTDEVVDEKREAFAEATAPQDYSSHGTVDGYSGW